MSGPDGPRAVRVVVHGHVQGVFFRDSLRQCADNNGVAGWARNRDDGAVETLLEGSPNAVETVLDFCREGPSRADVQDVEATDVSPEGLSGFQVH